MRPEGMRPWRLSRVAILAACLFLQACLGDIADELLWGPGRDGVCDESEEDGDPDCPPEGGGPEVGGSDDDDDGWPPASDVSLLLVGTNASAYSGRVAAVRANGFCAASVVSNGSFVIASTGPITYSGYFTEVLVLLNADGDPVYGLGTGDVVFSRGLHSPPPGQSTVLLDIGTAVPTIGASWTVGELCAP